jgi:hypothetical protein
MRQNAGTLLGASLLLAVGTAANATDTYIPSSRQVSIPSVTVGSETLTNVVATVSSIVTLPSGTSANGSVDSYNPTNQQLTVQSVLVGSTTYYNVVVALASQPAATIGGATNADTFANGQLTINSIQLGSTVYTGVVVNVALGNIQSIGGGLPTQAADTYVGGVLTLPAVNAFGHTYTNVKLGVAPSAIAGVGGKYTNVLSTGFYANGSTATGTSATGNYGTYSGGANNPAAGSGGGYLDSSPPANPTYEYIYIQDTAANLAGFTYQGVYIQPPTGQTVSATGANALTFALGINPEWFASTSTPNFVVLLTTNVPGVSTTSPVCNPAVAAVVTATSANSTVYNVPLTAFTSIRGNCGNVNVTAAQIVAGNIVQVDFQADGGTAAITANGLTSNINTTVPAGATAPATGPTDQYPTTISVTGAISFVTASLPPPPPPPTTTNVVSTGFYSNGTTSTSITGQLGSYGTYQGTGGGATANGSGGGYLDSSPPASPTYEYIYISDTLANIGGYDYQGVFVKPATSQTVSMVGKNNLSATVGVNPEWFANTAGANFVAEITVNVAGVSVDGGCSPQIWAVVPAVSANATLYTIPLGTMAIAQNCGKSVTLSQILAGNVTQVDFQADGGGSAITVNGITSNSNLTVPAGASAPANSPTALYPTSISVVGGVSFVN